MTTSCGNNLKFYGSFCGRVIDYKTDEPIEGAVVAASWNTLNFTDQNHSFTRPAKVAEVVSNKAGEFCLYGRGLALFPYQPSVEIFKAGYKSIGSSGDGSSGDTLLNSTLTLDVESVNFRSWLESHVL